MLHRLAIVALAMLLLASKSIGIVGVWRLHVTAQAPPWW